MAKHRKCQVDDVLSLVDCLSSSKTKTFESVKPDDDDKSFISPENIDANNDKGKNAVGELPEVKRHSKTVTLPNATKNSQLLNTNRTCEFDSTSDKSFDAIFCLPSSDLDSDNVSVPNFHLSKRSRRKRIKQKPPQSPVTCHYCEEGFESKYTRDQHISKHHPVSHQCPVVGCSYRSGMRNRMRQHEVRTHGNNAVQCPIFGCDGRFVKRNLARHIREYHKNRESEKSAVLKLSEEKLKCEYCNFASRHQLKYENHVLDEHLTGVNCPVQDCSLNMTGSKVAKHFELDHSGVPYVYKPGVGIKVLNPTDQSDNVGVVSVSETDTDVEYVTIQNAQKVKFICTHCQKICTNRVALRRHIARVHAKTYKIHTPKQQLPCTYDNCNRVFRCQALLSDHICRHKGEFVYDCKSCEQKFVTRAQFSIHLRKFHNTSIKNFEKANTEVEKGKKIFNLSSLSSC